MNTRKCGLDLEKIIVCACIAVFASIGIIFMLLSLLNIDIYSCNLTLLVLTGSVVSGVIWTILLCRNC